MNPPFNAWLEGLKFYGPVLLLGLILMIALRPYGYWWVGLPVFILGIGMLLFFRDFPRTITAAPNEVVSPADGTIVAIEDLPESPHYAGPCRRVSIFLSVFSAHVNRAPYEGAVTAVKYQPGRYIDARKPESGVVNESNAVWMETPGGAMTIRQISGAVARRIVCPVTEGTNLAKGEKFGMIRFGSRTELYLPPGTEVTVKESDKVYAGTSIVARIGAPS